MGKNNYVVDLLGMLDQKKTKKQINADLKQIEKTINMLRITGTFARGETKKNLNSYIKSLQSQLNHVKLTTRLEGKGLKKDIDKALNNLSFKDIDAISIDGNKAGLKVRKVIADVKSYVAKNPVSIGINYENRRSKLDNDLTAYLNKNTKIKESGVLVKESERIRELIETVKDSESLSEATDAFRLFKSEVNATGFAGAGTIDKIKSMLSHISKIGSAFGLASLATNNFVQSLKTLRSNDTILTEISKTSEMTKKQLQELGDEAFKIAGKYGRLSSDFLLASQEMAKAGYSSAVKEMAELSMKVQGAGDMTAQLSNQYIIATDKTFQMNGSIESLTAALDGANNITNNHALSMADLGESMSIVGSQAASSGMKVNETTAAVAAMIAVTQKSGSEVAKAFNGILMNLRQVTGEVDGEEIDAESLTRYEKACAELGVSLSAVKDGMVSLKEPMQIIRELSEAYTQLDESDARRTNLLSAVGGKDRADVLNALLENYDLYSAMLQDYADGLGSMDQEAEKTAKSWEGRLNSLSNSFTSFINTLTNKDAVLGGISFFDRLIQGADSLVNTFGEIPVILTAVNSSLVAMNKNYGITQIWDDDNRKIDIEGNIFGIDISRIKNQKKHFEEAEKAIFDWNSKLLQGQTYIEKFEESVVKNNASLKEYLSTCSQEAPASIQGYRQYLKSTGQATDELRLKTILLNSALTFLGGIAADLALKVAAAAWDAWNVTVEESQEKVNGIADKLKNLNAELTELKDIQNKTQYDHQRMQQLESEIKLQERLLEIEQKRLYQNRIGTKFSDYFDKDSLVTKKRTEEDRYNKTGYAYLSKQYEKTKSDLEYYNSEIASLQNRIKDGTIEEKDRPLVETEINILLRERDKILSKQTELQEQLTLNSSEYLSNYQLAQEAVDSGLLTGDDLVSAQEMAEYWSRMYSDTISIITGIQKANGTFDHSNVIRDILAKADFRETAHSLEKLGKSGKLSMDILTSRFPDLISYLKDAGVNADELYQYIMKLSDPDAIRYGETERMLKESLGIRDGEIGGASDQKKWDEMRNAFEGEEWQTVLEAYLTVRDQYGEHPEGWNAEDWIANMQNELENNPLDIEYQPDTPTISSSVQQIARQLEPQFTKLAEAYQSIFKFDDRGIKTFSLNDVDNAMLENLRQSFAEIEKEIGVTFDPSVLNPFFDTLFDESSTSEEVRQAFNDIATAYFYSTETLAQLNEETADAIEKQLEEMGVTNANEVVTAALAEKELELAVSKEYLAQTSKELADATGSEIAQFGVEQISAGECSEALALFYLKKALLNTTFISTSADVNNILTLAKAAGVTSESLTKLENAKAEFDAAVASGNAFRIGGAQAAMQIALNEVKNDVAAFQPVELDFDKIAPVSKAKSSGKEAADAYLEAFEEELGKLKDLKDRGKITEKEYLDQLRKLYEKYFKDKKQYLDQYNKYESEYLQGIKSLYESAFNTIAKQYDKKIDAANKAKDAAVSALEKERDAAKEAIQDQIDSIDRQIKYKEKIIDGIQDEIDAIRDANEERKREIDLQKAKYELEHAKHQRTRLVYKDGQLQYLTDPEAIRDKQEEVKEAETEIEIAGKEKQIKQIEKEISLLEDKKDVLNDQMDAIDKYYDKLISGTENYWDQIINGFEEYKSRYEELADMESDAKAMADLKQLCEEMGVTVEEVLGMSDEAFQKFRDRYTSALADIYSGNDQMTAAIAEQAGKTTDQLGSYLADTQEFVNGLNALDLSSAAEGLEAAASGMDKVADSASKAGGSMESVSAEMSSVNEAASGITENLSSVSESLASITGAEKIDGIAGSFERLAGSLVAIANALGISKDSSVSSLAAALSEIASISLEGNGDGLVKQFGNLKEEINSVISAVGGGGKDSSGGTGQGNNAGSSGQEESTGTGSPDANGGNSLTGAITKMGETAKKIIGEPEAEGDGTVIGEFGSLETVVTNVADAIGSGSDGSDSTEKKDAGDNNLIDAITDLGTVSANTLGEPGGEGVIGRFENMSEPLAEANKHITGIKDGLDEIDKHDVVECTIRVNIETTGGIPAFATGTALDSMNLNSAEYNAKYAGKSHAEGTALVSGNWAVQSNEQSALVGEEGFEIIVRDGRFFTVGNNGAEMTNIKRGDIVFNHAQSEQLLKYGHISGRGKAYADGTVGGGKSLTSDGQILYPIEPGDRALELQKASQSFLEKISYNIEYLTGNAMAKHEKQMDEIVRNVTSNNVVTNNNRNVQQPVTIQIGDIHLTGVQDENGLAKAIITRLPGKMMQEYFKN